MLAPPAVSLLRADAGLMERSLSADIREEREDLREAAEQTLNVIMDLDMSGTINWVSPSWEDVIGTTLDSVQGKPIVDLLVGEEKGVFADCLENMKKDDSRSQIIRFTLELGPTSRLARKVEEAKEGEDQETETIVLEGQGIMVYDKASGSNSHVRRVPASRYMLTFIDNVDDSSLGRSSGNPDRSASIHRGRFRIRSRDAGEIPHDVGRSWSRRPRQPPPAFANSVPHLRASDSSLVVREAH